MASFTGPVPNRSDQRVRRNKDAVEVEKVPVSGEVPVPELNIPDAHPFVVELYESMQISAQRKYYEPSDWAYAKTTLHFLNGLLLSSRPSAQMLAAVNSMLTQLLLTEGERRRVRIEVERSASTSQDATVISIADRFAEMLNAK